MIAAQMLREREGHAIESIYGTVATGVWKFLKLLGAVAAIDLSAYYIVRDRVQQFGHPVAGGRLPCLIDRGAIETAKRPPVRAFALAPPATQPPPSGPSTASNAGIGGGKASWLKGPHLAPHPPKSAMPSP